MNAASSDLSRYSIGDLPFTSYIEGAFIPAAGAPMHPTFDPASGEVLPSVAIASTEVVAEAVASSTRALRVWRSNVDMLACANGPCSESSFRPP